MGQSLSSTLSLDPTASLASSSSSPILGFRDYSDQERHVLHLLRALDTGAPTPALALAAAAAASPDATAPAPAPVVEAVAPKDLPAPLSTVLLHHGFALHDLVPLHSIVAILRLYLVAFPTVPSSTTAAPHALATSASLVPVLPNHHNHHRDIDDTLLLDDDTLSALSLSETSSASLTSHPRTLQQQQHQHQQQQQARSSRAAVSPLPHPSLTRGHSSPHLPSSHAAAAAAAKADDHHQQHQQPTLFALTLPDVLPLRATDLDSQVNVGLCSKGLVQLTPWIALLKNATVLQLCCNQLESLPAHVAHLHHLTVLSVAKNKLASLPPELGHLTQLVELDVSHNRLTDLPSSLGHLSKLHILRVDHNRLARLPRALGRLTNLVSLDVSDNPLTTLPAELARLKHLRKLRTRNCSLVHLTSHSPLALNRPEPASAVPTLRELAARKLIATRAPVDLTHLPRDLAAYLVSYDSCAFCWGPMFEHRVYRCRKFVKNDHVLPLEFELCSNHWTSERQRVRAMFTCPTAATTRDAEADAHKDALRAFATQSKAATPAAAAAAAASTPGSPSMHHARTGSPKPSPLFGFASPGSPLASASPALVPPRSRTPSLPWISLTRSRKPTAHEASPALSPALGALLSPEFAPMSPGLPMSVSTPTLGSLTHIPPSSATPPAAGDYYATGGVPSPAQVDATLNDVLDVFSTTSSGVPLPTRGPVTALAAVRHLPPAPGVPARHPPAPAPAPPATTQRRSSLSFSASSPVPAQQASPRLNKRSLSVPQLPRSVTSSALGFISRSRTPTATPSLPMVDEAAYVDVPPRVPSGAGYGGLHAPPPRPPSVSADPDAIQEAPVLVQHAGSAFPDLVGSRPSTPPPAAPAADEEDPGDAFFKSNASQRSSRLGGWVARVSRLGGRWGARRGSASGSPSAAAAAAAGEQGVEHSPSLMAAQAE